LHEPDAFEENGRVSATRASGLSLGLLFAAAFAFALYRIRFGLGFGFDEGFYLATPLRYALGDLPFRDEFFNPLRMFDLVLAPWFRIFPDLSLYALRLGQALVQLAATAALALLFSRFAPTLLVGAACAATIWIPNLIWSPGYHVMGGTFFTLGWSLWLLGCLQTHRTSAIALAFMSAVAFFLGAVSYLPLFAVAIVPAVVLLHELARGERESPRRLATLVHLVTLAALAVAGVGLLVGAGLGDDWLDATATINSLGYYKVAPAKKVGRFVAQLGPYLPLGIAGAAIGAALVGVAHSGRTSRLATTVASSALSLCLLWLFFGLPLPSMGRMMGDELTRPFRVVVLSLGLALGLAATAKLAEREAVDRDWRLVSRCVLAGSLLFAFLHGFLSSMAWKAIFAAPPLVVCITVALHRALAGARADTARRRFAFVATCVTCVAVAAVAYHTRAALPAGEHARFSHPRLTGILAPRAEVAKLERLLDELSHRVHSGGYLLAYDDLPLLYFLTGTRPAIDHAWTSRVIPSELRMRSLRRMIAAGRVPRVAVRSLHPLSVGYPNAIHRFVREHYRLELSLPGYEVWTLKDAADSEEPFSDR
jgi:hypothetical protein